MKCRSIACIWSESPPVHRVTAAAVLDQPPSLYTGGSDGTIVCWNLSTNDAKPIAMLCSHAAPIADISICYPSAVPGNELPGGDLSSNVVPNSNSVNYGALISVCTDGVLCIWSRISGHCLRRRRLPPWVGSPSIIRTLPDNRRYVCIACDSVHSSDHKSHDSTESREVIQQRKPSKGTVVIVDSYTLTIVQTVFHGNLSIGPLKFMSVLNVEKQSVLMADSFGKVQCVSIINDSDPSGKKLSGGPKGIPSNLEITEWVHGTNEEGIPLVAFLTKRQVLALVYPTHCVFRLVDGGTTIGEIYFKGNQLCLEDSACQSHATGAMFLESYDLEITPNNEDPDNTFVATFAVWNNKGFAVIYSISYLDNFFKFEVLSSIPAVSDNSTRLLVSFVQLNSSLVRIESSCFHSEEPLPWKPRVTTWLLPAGNLNQECKMFGKSSFFNEWNHEKREGHDEPLVTSSMIISENYCTPYAVVYGYKSGEIEVVNLHMFYSEPDSSQTFKHHLFGHTGAVLCLAAYQVVNHSKISNFNRVLVSGSMDCTVRIWDLDSHSLISVMHQHISPVRQIILPPPQTDPPWTDCFLSVGEDSCVAVTSLESLRVERMFPGHPYYPAKVVWDSTRGYIACLCLNDSLISDLFDVLYIWDIKTGARERVLRGTAAHSMFDHFYNGINVYSLNGNTSASSFVFPMIEDTSLSLKDGKKGGAGSQHQSTSQRKNHAVKCSCPFPGIAALSFDLASLISLCKNPESSGDITVNSENYEWSQSVEHFLLQFALSILHLWNVDAELDQLLITEMNLKRPGNFLVSSGLLGDRGSITLSFPGSTNSLELWKRSSEFCSIRSLAMVSLAQHMVSLSHSCSAASRALAAFYTRNFAEKIPDIQPPSLQLLVSFWQDESEHVRMAARSLFHCAASRAIPPPLSCNKLKVNSQTDDSEILSWIESFEIQDWISCVEGTSQDAMTSHIIVAAALAVWYPSLVKPNLAILTIHSLMKLVMAMNEKYSSTAAEILAEGMESTWKECIISEIPRLIGEIFFQIESASAVSASSSAKIPAAIQESLIGILLPSLAMADILGFLNVIESQIWSTASDSPVHIVSLMTLIRVVRGSPRNLAQYLDKVVNFILQTMDPGNSVMRKTCLQSSTLALKEVVRVYPMVALNNNSSRLAVGDALGNITTSTIRVFEMLSMSAIKVLDASGPPGLPHLLGGALETGITTTISALSFAPDGEGIVAFSEHGLMIRWWSLESVWWEKISRNLVPVHCTKLIFVPPWEGFSPNSTRSSIMASSSHTEKFTSLMEKAMSLSEVERIKSLIHNLDLSYRLEWVSERKVQLKQHGRELGIFQL